MLDSPDGQDERDDFQQSGHHCQAESDGRWHLFGNKRVQEAGEGKGKEDGTGQQHIQQGAEDGTGKSLHWGVADHLRQK